jgi:hypothetical protein
MAAQAMVAADEVQRIRLLVFFNRVGDSDLRIARDLLSHRVYREEFWRAAARRGRSEAFLPSQSFESSDEGHGSFRAAGLRRVVAIVDPSFGGDEPPGVYANSEEDDLEHCSAQSLETVGVVTLDALEVIARRLAKIDRFADSPLAEVSDVEPEPARVEEIPDAEEDGAEPGVEAEAGEAQPDAEPEVEAGEAKPDAEPEAAVGEPETDVTETEASAP